MPATLFITDTTQQIEKKDENRKIPTIDGDDDPLVWLKCHSRKFRLLSQAARKYLAISASSSPSERLFSKAGQVVSSQRAQMKPDLANMIVFLAENL